MDNGELLQDPGTGNPKMDVFLLTKTPKSGRSRLCLRLIAQSENAALYLAGDGVYNLLDEALEALPRVGIFACAEDLEARGVQPGSRAIILVDFYERLVEDMMLDRNRIYTF